MTGLEALLQAARRVVAEVGPAATAAELAGERPPILVDVREADEWEAGHAEGAVHVPRGRLELRIDDAVPDAGRRLILYCGGGTRSLLAGEALRRMGRPDVASMAGGFRAWREAGLPVAAASSLSAADRRRYARHLSIPEVGEAGQERLLAARVLLVGAGGLGSPAALYLAAAGVGTLGIVDFDVVDETNLQRQVLHATSRLGRPKTESARAALLDLNPGVRVDAFPERLTAANVERILGGFQVVVDGSDNFPTRYLVNDACVRLGLPNVHGSVFRFDGQATVFWPGRGPCYRCLFPQPPPPGAAPSCAEAGVLGVLPGVIGLLQAVETIKIVLGIGAPLVGRLACYDALAGTLTELALRRDESCRWCADGAPFQGYVEMEPACEGG